MARASSGNHVWLKVAALPELQRVYGHLDAEATWTVVAVDGGYEGRDGLHLEGGEPPRRILAWRCQVRAVPRCEACGLEGHTLSRGTAKTCAVQAEMVAQSRQAASRRMKERWVAIKAGLLPAPAAAAPQPEERAS